MRRRRTPALVAAVFAVLSGGAFASSHPTPLTFSWPTSVDVVSKRAVLVVANGTGRVLLVDPVTGRTRPLYRATRAYAVAHAPAGGGFFLSAGSALLRLDASGHASTLVTSADEVGPIAVARGGAVYYATTTQILRLDSSTPLASGLDGPHGLALTGDGGLLVSDQGHGKILRIDLRTRAAKTWTTLGAPRGIVVAPDRTVYVADGASRRVVHLTIEGRRLGAVKHAFRDPYAVAAGRDGSLYVVDTAASGRLYRVAANGKTTVLSR